MEHSFGWSAIETSTGVFDRVMSSARWRQYNMALVTNGVYVQPTSNLQVLASGGLQITVKNGIGFINGAFYINDTDLTAQLDAGEAQNRMDSVVLRFNLSARQVSVGVTKGIPSQNPAAPAPQRDNNIHDLVLAHVLVRAATSSITQTDITDTRANTALCGWTTGAVDQIDTTDLFAQFSSAFNEQLIRQDSEFNIWFESVKDLLRELEAGDLIVRTDAIETALTEVFAPTLLWQGPNADINGTLNLTLNEPIEAYGGCILRFYARPFTGSGSIGIDRVATPVYEIKVEVPLTGQASFNVTFQYSYQTFDFTPRVENITFPVRIVGNILTVNDANAIFKFRIQSTTGAPIMAVSDAYWDLFRIDVLKKVFVKQTKIVKQVKP